MRRVSYLSGSPGFLRQWPSPGVARARIWTYYDSTVTFCSDIGGRFDTFVDVQIAIDASMRYVRIADILRRSLARIRARTSGG